MRVADGWRRGWQYKGQPWFNRFHVYLLTLTCLLVLCMLYSLFPARRIPTIITMAPTMDKATERLSIAMASIFLARELVINDGVTRMTTVTPPTQRLTYCLHHADALSVRCFAGRDLGDSRRVHPQV